MAWSERSERPLAENRAPISTAETITMAMGDNSLDQEPSQLQQPMISDLLEHMSAGELFTLIDADPSLDSGLEYPLEDTGDKQLAPFSLPPPGPHSWISDITHTSESPQTGNDSKQSAEFPVLNVPNLSIDFEGKLLNYFFQNACQLIYVFDSPHSPCQHLLQQYAAASSLVHNSVLSLAYAFFSHSMDSYMGNYSSYRSVALSLLASYMTNLTDRDKGVERSAT